MPRRPTRPATRPIARAASGRRCPQPRHGFGACRRPVAAPPNRQFPPKGDAQYSARRSWGACGRRCRRRRAFTPAFGSDCDQFVATRNCAWRTCVKCPSIGHFNAVARKNPILQPPRKVCPVEVLGQRANTSSRTSVRPANASRNPRTASASTVASANSDWPAYHFEKSSVNGKLNSSALTKRETAYFSRDLGSIHGSCRPLGFGAPSRCAPPRPRTDSAPSTTLPAVPD